VFGHSAQPEGVNLLEDEERQHSDGESTEVSLGAGSERE